MGIVSFHKVYIHRLSAMGCGETCARGVEKNIRARCLYTESSHHPPRFPNRPRRAKPTSYQQSTYIKIFTRNETSITRPPPSSRKSPNLPHRQSLQPAHKQAPHNTKRHGTHLNYHRQIFLPLLHAIIFVIKLRTINFRNLKFLFLQFM